MSIPQDPRHTLRRTLVSLAFGVGVGLAAQAEALTSFEDDELDSLLDPDDGARTELVEHVGDVIESASVLTRTRLLGAWVTSQSPRVRWLAARTLQRPFVVLGAGSALDLLRNDVDPDVQSEARIASLVRCLPQASS